MFAELLQIDSEPSIEIKTIFFYILIVNQRYFLNAKKIFVIFILVLSNLLFSKAKPHKGVILIVIDTLAKEHLQSFNYFRKTSPFLLNLSKNNILFSNVFSASSHTVPSVSSILTGKYPYAHGIQYFFNSKSFHPTLSVEKGGFPNLQSNNKLIFEFFKENNFYTTVFQTNPWLKAEYGFSRGVDDYYFFDSNANNKYYADGDDVNKLIVQKTLPKIADKDFFIYIHYMDVHSPYYKPKTFKGLYTKFEKEPIYVNDEYAGLTQKDIDYSIALYDEGINFVDNSIKTLFTHLQDNKLLDNTLVIITADHGEEFYQHGGLGHGRTLYNEVKNSFIICIHPKFIKKKIKDKVCLIDILPTILDWAKIDYKKTAFDGFSLIPAIQSKENVKKRILFSELGEKKAIIDGKMEYIYNVDKKIWEFYNIENDKNENNPLNNKILSGFNKYKKIMNGILKKSKNNYKSSKLSEEDLKKLKSLGYLQ